MAFHSFTKGSKTKQTSCAAFASFNCLRLVGSIDKVAVARQALGSTFSNCSDLQLCCLPVKRREENDVSGLHYISEATRVIFFSKAI